MGHQYPHPPHLFRESMRFEVGRGETERIKQSLQCQCGRANSARENSCLSSSTLHTDMEQDCNKLTETGDSFSLMTDCDLDFPPILDCTQQKSTEVADGGVMPHTRKITFAQVVSKDFVSDDAKQNCCEETKHSPNTELESDDGMSSGEKHTDDGRYELLLDFAIKRGYSESNFEKVIGRCGLACDKDLLLRELIRNSSESENLEMKCLDDLKAGSERNMESGDENRMEVSMVPDDRPAEAQEVKKEEESEDAGNNLRDIIIDGSNVAMSHGQKGVFSCRGIQLAVDWFRDRGHRNIIAFVPRWRKETPHPDRPMSDQHLLLKLEEEGIVKFTPSRRVNGHRVVCYDDRYMLKEAAHTQGIVVSNDNYRDLRKESEAFRTVVDERLLMYIFVNDRFIPPEDPLGRTGPTLDNFLRKQPSNGPTMKTECPYKDRCTYGTKCKYSHPWRGTLPHKMVSEGLKEQAKKEMQKRRAEAMELKETSSGVETKLARTPSRAQSQHRPTEKNSSVSLSRVPQESHTDTDSPSKSPAASSVARDSHYLREHRKKLEKELAMASLGNPGPTNENTPLYNMWGSDSVNQHEDGFNGISVFSQERRPCKPPHVPSTYSNEGQLVSGHLQLAKKLSDESSGSTFFAQEYPRPERIQSGSLPRDAYQTDRPLFEGNCYYNHPSLLPNYHHHHGQNPVPQYAIAATVPWISEAPCGTVDPLSGGPRHSPCLQPAQYSSPGGGPPAQGFPVHAGPINQHQYPHLSRQPDSFQISQSPQPQTFEGVISSKDSAMPPVSSVGSLPHWGEGPMYPNQTFTPFHYPQSPRYPSPPPPAFSPPAGSRPPWQANTPPPPLGPPTHPPPVAPRTGPSAQPGCVDSNPPMAVTDPRSLLYLQLCDVFAHHVVQAVMTKYPEERNFHNLYAYILTELSLWSDV